MVAGSNYGESCALYEPGCRTSGKGAPGLNTANPSGYLLTAANMLKYIGFVLYFRITFF